MILDEEATRNEDVLAAARAALSAARTAPKTRGIDNLFLKLVDGDDLNRIATAMEEEAGQKPEKRGHFVRDAHNLRASCALILVGVKNAPCGLDCGWCGFPDCAQKGKNPGVYCVFNPMDQGIAIGSLVSALADRRIDNRVMFSIGFAAKALGLFPADVGSVVGIPLSVSRKSPFFDRK